MAYLEERRIAIRAVRKAARLCETVRKERIRAAEVTLMKEDRSPVTVADFGAQAVVSLELREAFSHVTIVGEETAEPLRNGSGTRLRRQVVESVEAVLPGVSEPQVLAAIDACSDSGGPRGRRWVLDPVDGTRGFLRNEQYAIALALLEDGEVVLGVLGCPNLPATHLEGGGAGMAGPGATAAGARGCLFVAVKGEGSFVRRLEGGGEEGEETPIQVTSVHDPKDASFCESVESGHSHHGRHARIAHLLGVHEPPLRMDSQCKYAAIARGEASIYLRLPTSQGYEERIWDHAAGLILVQEAGGEVSDVTGRRLDFSCGRTLRRNRGVVATNAKLHRRVQEAVSRVLAAEGAAS